MYSYKLKLIQATEREARSFAYVSEIPPPPSYPSSSSSSSFSSSSSSSHHSSGPTPATSSSSSSTSVSSKMAIPFLPSWTEFVDAVLPSFGQVVTGLASALIEFVARFLPSLIRFSLIPLQIPSFTGLSLTWLSYFLNPTEFDSVLSSSTGFHRALTRFTEFYRVLLGETGV